MLTALLLLASSLIAQDPPKAAAPKAHDAITAVPRPDEWWTKRHEAMNARVKEGDVGLLFIGDSITQGWETEGKDVWAEFYAKRKAVNLGIGGDRTQHVLWRLDHGNLDGLGTPAGKDKATPKLAVLMIGTNNSNGEDNTAREIADGQIAIVKKLREKLPATKVLVLAIFPRGEKPNPQREKNAAASALVKKEIADGKEVRFLDIGDRFLEKDGTLTKEIMPDFLHLSPKGYRIWADAIESEVKAQCDG
ncbi:MAG TPA: platelet-activating factor acetylhydrolase IB subunit [Pirellulaceae bacterium]|nr:platelet-activating factor acetylhydrolase IB subunit [Pirellulaceae bacterium]